MGVSTRDHPWGVSHWTITTRMPHCAYLSAGQLHPPFSLYSNDLRHARPCSRRWLGPAVKPKRCGLQQNAAAKRQAYDLGARRCRPVVQPSSGQRRSSTRLVLRSELLRRAVPGSRPAAQPGGVRTTAFNKDRQDMQDGERTSARSAGPQTSCPSCISLLDAVRRTVTPRAPGRFACIGGVCPCKG